MQVRVIPIENNTKETKFTLAEQSNKFHSINHENDIHKNKTQEIDYQLANNSIYMKTSLSSQREFIKYSHS